MEKQVGWVKQHLPHCSQIKGLDFSHFDPLCGHHVDTSQSWRPSILGLTMNMVVMF